MPIDGLKLIVEKRHPRAATLNGAEMKSEHVAEVLPEQRSRAKLEGRKLKSGEYEAGMRWRFLMNTLGVAANECWSIEAEMMAITKLRELVTPQAFKCYMLSGCFLETSKRSRVTYLFRKLRPTIALRETTGGVIWPIAVLCLHPIGLYEDSWAGVMVPTDDVIAHLMMMRADEHMYWRKANHHPIESPNAGI